MEEACKTVHYPVYDTDALMRNLWLNLANDFTDGDEMLKRYVNGVKPYILSKQIPMFRTVEPETYWLSKHLYFKKRYQLENLFKRHRFHNDLYTQKELSRKTIKKFLDVQSKISAPMELSYRTSLVVQTARRIITKILGPYVAEEHVPLCRFGKRASVGNPNRKSYLDEKLGVLSGSCDHIEWFKTHLLSDTLLRDAIVQCTTVPNYVECEKLKLTLVPKSFKSLRCIMPNTTIGSFYTYGLGKYIQSRLTANGVHIPTLQDRHRHLVRAFSRTRSHVTADLSSASDTFTGNLIHRLVPRDWYKALNFGRIKTVDIEGKDYHLASFMTMGIGFTFPLQTLLFYGLLKAIQQLTSLKGLISVYGDDLIYPREMHRYVKGVFEDLRFSLNMDKTFVHQNFRESCGNDAYCGIDVRPFQPEGSHQLLRAKQYEMLLYKTINGLALRWEEFEIRGTLRFLKLELLKVTSFVLQVPPSFPDFSGVKVTRPIKDYLYPWSQVRYDENLSYNFAFLTLAPKDRIVLAQMPYYWESLRSGGAERDVHFNPYDLDENTSAIHWRKCDPQPKNYRSSLTRKRLKKLIAVVASKELLPAVQRQRATSHNWT